MNVIGRFSMTGRELVQYCKKRGIEVYLDIDKPRVRAPQGAVTDDLRSQLKAARGEVVVELQRQDAMACCRCGGWGTVMFEMVDGDFLCARCWNG
jgi:hypothetical protein